MGNKNQERPSRNNSSVETQTDNKAELHEELHDESHKELNDELHDELHDKLQDELHEDLHEELHEELHEDLHEELNDESHEESQDTQVLEDSDEISDCIDNIEFQEVDFKNESPSDNKSYYQKLEDLLNRKATRDVLQNNIELLHDNIIHNEILNNELLNDKNMHNENLNNKILNDNMKNSNLNDKILSDASTQTDTVINSEVQTTKHLKLLRKVSKDSEIRSYIEDNLLTLVCKLEDKDYPFLFSLIPEYIKTGFIFLPQNNILSEILKKGIFPVEEYSLSIFKMGQRKLYSVLCTFIHCKEEFSILELMCKVEYKMKISSESVEVTLSNIKKDYKGENIIRITKLGKFLEQLYHPMTPEQILNYKFNNPVSKEVFMNNNIMREMDSKILVSNGKGLVITILDYLIISFDKSNKKS